MSAREQLMKLASTCKTVSLMAVPWLRPCTSQVMFIVTAGAVGDADGVTEADTETSGRSVKVEEPDAELVAACEALRVAVLEIETRAR